MRTALVVSGGGPKGAFAVGAIKSLRERNVIFDSYYGTSTGALIVPFAALDEIEYLERMYTSIKPGEIYGRRWLPLALLFRPGIFSMRPLRKLLERDLTEDMFLDLQLRNVWVATYNLNIGDTIYWGLKPSTQSKTKTTWVRDRHELIQAMIASASIPVISDPITIRGERYVDGGVQDIAPIHRAVMGGADRVIAITLGSPTQYDGKVKGIVDIANRTIAGMSAEVLRNDINCAHNSLAEAGRKVSIIHIQLKKAYVEGTKWTASDMRQQFQHGFEEAESVTL